MLSSRDRKLLQSILDRGHALEKRWPDAVSADQAPVHAGALDHLVALIEQTSEAESEDLKRLSIHTRDLTQSMSAKHLASILVPFERLLGRALRDDEISVNENDLQQPVAEKGNLVVIADNLRSAFNVGAILRTADCFGLREVLFTGYTPTPDDDKTLKTSMGTEKAVAWRSVKTSAGAITQLKAEGYTVIALETTTDAVSLIDFQWPAKPALLLGNERFGVGFEELAQVDQVIRIPMFGAKNSLNVGIAFGVAANDWRTKLSLKNTAVTAAPLTLAKIGTYYSSAKHPYEARRQGANDDSGEVAKIELENGRDFEQALKDLDGFTRVWLVYQFHHNANWKPMVMPPRGPRVKRGVFATRSPYRPNPLGLSCVELVGVEGRHVYVRGSDLLNETPILDIKPYIPYADSFPEAEIGWLKTATETFEVSFSTTAREKLDWLHSHGAKQIEGFLKAQLEFDPLDDERKRVSAIGGQFILAYRTWRARFTIQGKVLIVDDLKSGYTKDELDSALDSYQDKALHRHFNATFNESPSS